jgi:hypothetical protein
MISWFWIEFLLDSLGSNDDDDILICKEWMKPFSEVLRNSLSNSSIPSSPDIPNDEVYSIQIHNISIDLLVN